MKTYRFHFNTEYAADLRDAVNDRRKQSIDNEHEEKRTKGKYCAWDRTCAAKDRLEDTLAYLNSLELGNDSRMLEAVIPYFEIENGELTCLELLPVELGIDEPRYRIGTPSVCFDRGIIERLAEMSRPYGTTISVDEKGLGFVALESGKSGSEEA